MTRVVYYYRCGHPREEEPKGATPLFEVLEELDEPTASSPTVEAPRTYQRPGDPRQSILPVRCPACRKKRETPNG